MLVGVLVNVGVNVGVFVNVGVTVGVFVNVGVAVGVFVNVGVTVGVSGGEIVFLSVRVSVRSDEALRDVECDVVGVADDS